MGSQPCHELRARRAGALAGAITGVATTPLDVVKTRLMTQGATKAYSGVIDCVRKIWQEEGSAAFLRVRRRCASGRPTPARIGLPSL